MREAYPQVRCENVRFRKQIGKCRANSTCKYSCARSARRKRLTRSNLGAATSPSNAVHPVEHRWLSVAGEQAPNIRATRRALFESTYRAADFTAVEDVLAG